MPQVYETKSWRLQIPEAWAVRADKEQRLVTLFRPDGLGILTVLTDEGQPNTHEGKLEEFRGQLRGTTWSLAGADRFTRHWNLRCGSRRLLIMYSCAAKNADLERSQVDEILQSISEVGSEAA